MEIYIVDYAFIKDLRNCNSLHYLTLNYGHSNMLGIVQLLVEKGLDLSQMDKKQSTKIVEFLCLNYRHPNLLDIFQLLFNKGLDLFKSSEPPDVLNKQHQEKKTLETLCRNYKHNNVMDVVQLLLEHGFEVDSEHIRINSPTGVVDAEYIQDKIAQLKDMAINIDDDRTAATAPSSFMTEKGTSVDEPIIEEDDDLSVLQKDTSKTTSKVLLRILKGNNKAADKLIVITPSEIIIDFFIATLIIIVVFTLFVAFYIYDFL